MSLLQIIGSRRLADDSERDTRVDQRVRTLQIEATDQSIPSGLANLPAVVLFAFIIRNSAPASELYLWIAATIGVLTVLMLAVRGAQRGYALFAKGPFSDRLAVHAFFATLVGCLWGGAGLAFGPSLPETEMMLFTVMVLGCNAACVSGLGAYLPAFFGYCAGSSLPLICVLYIRHETAADSMAVLALLYLVVLAANTRAYNRQVVSAFRLRAQNEVLAENVARANVAMTEAKESKWNTLAHLSHELRTPMNAIMGFSQMMRDQIFGPLADRYRDYSSHIHDSGRHLLDLIDTILDVSRAEAGQLTIDESEIAPVDLIEECLQKVGGSVAAKHLRLERDFEPSSPYLLADRTKLRQVLLNLLTNAINYTRDGGRISIRLARHEGGLEIAVSDSGVGIAPEDIERCQEPFVRIGNPLVATADGAGLGLPIARRLTEAHGGHFRLASELGHGTTATIHMPAARCVQPDAERLRA